MLSGFLYPVCVYRDVLVVLKGIIGLYREIAIAIQKESGDSNGGNV